MPTKGEDILTNTEELLKIIKGSGLRKGFIASKLGITTYAFQKKVENRSQFKAGEIKILCDLLDITSLKEKEKIFFAENVDEMPTMKEGK